MHSDPCFVPWNGVALARSNQVRRSGRLISHVPFFPSPFSERGANQMTDMAVEGRSASEHRGQLVNGSSLRVQKVHSDPCFGSCEDAQPGAYQPCAV